MNHNRPTPYYLYGHHAVQSALNNNKRVILQLHCTSKYAQQYRPLFDKTQISTSEELSRKLPNKDLVHQGVIALVQPITIFNIEELLPKESKDIIIILDQLNDPQNIGAIIRSAAAFGIHKIILPKHNTPFENGTIAKAASGCLELMQILQVNNLKNSINTLKKHGFWIAGMSGYGQNRLADLKNIDKLAIIIGSEGKGLRPLTESVCDFSIKININPAVESLNAANAATIVFHAISQY